MNYYDENDMLINFLRFNLLPHLQFKFDQNLYLELIKEENIDRDKNKIPNTGPKVEFLIDTDIKNLYILGEFYDKENLIRINILGNLADALLSIISTVESKNFYPALSFIFEQLKLSYKNRLINTLAHETKHWQLNKFKFWLSLEKWFLFIFFFLIELLLYIAIMVVIMYFIWGLNLTPIKCLFCIMPTFIIFVIFGLILSSKFAYYLNIDERRARKFAKKAEKDPRWQNVIII